ncbi:Hypothetical predicted protein [Mytilus galloprovincialis]|uniref:THAP-type domain-containing protein n=1 Tax=Mytilus galloprovincialis TaxID=29158 RepID=A0A8B6DHE8_MYTGA|nr:Hypothetical predicted protein [Mytilus galloprovincialis]
MESENKYKTGGGNSCSVHGCSNNRKKITLLKKSMCELHGEMHDHCPCLIPYRLHVMPSKELIRLEWIKALNRKDLPKNVYVCSEHFIDGKPTDRNPSPKLKMGYENKTTPGRRKILKHQLSVKKRKLETGDSDSDMEITELDTTLESEPGASTPYEKLPEAICSFNVIEASSTVSTQYLESDFLPQKDHTYGKEWTDFQTKSSQTNIVLTEEKGVQSKSDGATMSAAQNLKTDNDALLYTGVTKEVFFTLVKCFTPFNTFSFQLERPTNLRSRGETYSNYKSHNTAKYLVGISPHGQIMFISKAFGGRASDKFIVEKSGFMNYLLPGDEIMADRGFTIDDLLFPLRVKLNIPAFTKNKPQLSAEDVTTTRRIARVRIHVERVIRRLKVFKILSGTVPVSSLTLFDDILLVCSALVNLRSDLIRDTNESNE